MNTDALSTEQPLYQDIFGKLAAVDDRLIWQGSGRWWDQDDKSRWRTLGDLKHPAVVRVLESRPQSLTLEFQVPRGQPLSTFLDSTAEKPPLETLYGLALLVQLASALEAMHNLDIFGLSITPATVFVHPDTSAPSFALVPLLAPISAAGLQPEDFLLKEAHWILPYVAQERLRVQPTTPAADVYALGVLGSQILRSAQIPAYDDKAALIHALVAGRFQARIAPQGKGNADSVIRQCLARRPGRRPTASEARAGLSTALRESMCQPCEQARQHHEAGDFDAALQTLKEAMEDPILDRNPRLHLMYAEIIAQNAPVDSLAVIAACKAAAERVERLLDEEQMTDPMDRYFAAHLFASPADAQLTARQIYTLFGTTYRQENLLKKAIKQYDRALKVAGDEGQLLLNYAAMLRQAERPGEALSALERAEKVGVTNQHLFLLEKARAMERQGMLDQAIEAYTTALDIAQDGATWAQLGKLYLAKGPDERDNAMHAFRQAVELDPHQMEVATLVADLALEQDDEDAALAALDLVRPPSDFQQVPLPVWENYLALANVLMGRMSTRLAQNQRDPTVHRRLGDLFLLRAHLVDNPQDLVGYDMASKDYVRALLSYEGSMRLDPNQPKLLKKIEEIQNPLIQEQDELEQRIQGGDTVPDTYNRLALLDWRLATINAGLNTFATRRNAIALLKRAVEVLDLSIQQDLTQRGMRRLFGMLAEQLRYLESRG